MISPSGNFKLYLASKPVDFRKGMDGLAAIVMNEFDLDPFSGAIFIFRSKRSDRMKLIVWDGTGLVMTYKRIEGSGFVWPRMSDVRRKFLDVHKATKSEKAHQVFMLINDIYAVEHDLKGQPADVRRAVRQLESAPLVAQLQLLLLRLSGEVSMKSTLGQAISYTWKLWDGLNVFLSDGRVEMDNNAVENTIRPIALLRKNALFAGSEIGGRNWAVMASLIGTCRLSDVEPYAYLTWVFEQMANGHPRSRYEELLPWYCPNGKFGIE